MAKIPSGLRVLVVEDEFMIAMAVEAVVADAGGIVVEMAATLEQAMAFAETVEVDAALLDINLNGENSFPVAHILGKRGIPFAFVTGYGRKIVPDFFAHAPILTKPYARNDLMRVLGSLSTGDIL